MLHSSPTSDLLGPPQPFDVLRLANPPQANCPVFHGWSDESDVADGWQRSKMSCSAARSLAAQML
eukprot:4820702-Amphidinium_carterae.1